MQYVQLGYTKACSFHGLPHHIDSPSSVLAGGREPGAAAVEDTLFTLLLQLVPDCRALVELGKGMGRGWTVSHPRGAGGLAGQASPGREKEALPDRWVLRRLPPLQTSSSCDDALSPGVSSVFFYGPVLNCPACLWGKGAWPSVWYPHPADPPSLTGCFVLRLSMVYALPMLMNESCHIIQASQICEPCPHPLRGSGKWVSLTPP
ncbi:PREDICTED: uncharacterized protein LOC106146951 [Chinchilla lanigera]|uniref:uncharacterized protein LOC106146951 n=1 Tax=Chinchilla lanigera TaxID=34839 RepID=UPI0006973E62|nr:PREDICTED: uncharacterized protein LOC106146951 [Chinchilla lanigera]